MSTSGIKTSQWFVLVCGLALVLGAIPFAYGQDPDLQARDRTINTRPIPFSENEIQSCRRDPVCAGKVAYINEVDVYAKDNYNFIDDPGAWISQPLGYWNPKTGYVGKIPLEPILLPTGRFKTIKLKRAEAVTLWRIPTSRPRSCTAM